MSGVRSFRILAFEAVADAVRRRAVAAVAAVAVLSLLGVDSCTSCAGGQIMVNGQPAQLPEVAGATGVVTFTVLALWCMVLAGVLAADHLVQTLEDGSAGLSLARPVGRGTFAYARLAGALTIALATGAVLLGATTFLLGARSGLPPGPAVIAGAAFACGALIVAALGMTFSLYVPRVAGLLGVFALVGMTALANGLSLAGRAGDGWLGWLDRLGPPLASSVVLGLWGWLPEVEITGEPTDVLARVFAWVVLSLLALRAAFSRVELGGQAP